MTALGPCFSFVNRFQFAQLETSNTCKYRLAHYGVVACFCLCVFACYVCVERTSRCTMFVNIIRRTYPLFSEVGYSGIVYIGIPSTFWQSRG